MVLTKKAQTGVAKQASGRWSSFENGLLRRAFGCVAGWLDLSPLARQRVRMPYFAFAYWRLFTIPGVPAFRMLFAFLRIDFNVLHAHLPAETVLLTRELATRRAQPGEVVVEAGCWNGGTSTKFSILCDLLGYRLFIFDSFQGVERLSGEDLAREWDYAGQYASPESVLWENLRRYGKPGACQTFKGWFSETLASTPVRDPIRLVYIDCDLGKGTYEVLKGTVDSLAPDGVIFSQDFHIEPVRKVLLDPETWRALGRPMPVVTSEGVMIARINWPRENTARSAPSNRG
jgi:O-methyltransferase